MSVRELVRQTLESREEPDPHVVAREISVMVTGDHIDELVMFGLSEMVQEELRKDRDRRMSGPAVASTTGPSRWELAARVRVPSAEGWKFLEDCTVTDLDTLADRYAERAAELEDRSGEFRQFARLLEASGCKTFGQMVRKKGFPKHLQDLAA